MNSGTVWDQDLDHGSSALAHLLFSKRMLSQSLPLPLARFSLTIRAHSFTFCCWKTKLCQYPPLASGGRNVLVPCFGFPSETDYKPFKEKKISHLQQLEHSRHSINIPWTNRWTDIRLRNILKLQKFFFIMSLVAVGTFSPEVTSWCHAIEVRSCCSQEPLAPSYIRFLPKRLSSVKLFFFFN